MNGRTGIRAYGAHGTGEFVEIYLAVSLAECSPIVYAARIT